MTENDPKRVCNCPPEVRANCCCRRQDCDCFNGFKVLEIIMASAGTGKTYRLAMRFIQLLCFGVDPAEILAITFTKKAAGEIFDKIINRLLELAEAPGDAPTCDCCENFSRARFLDVLRRLLEMRRELQIGTIDSFFRKLTDVYAPELGIWGGVSLIDAHDARYRRRTLRKWLRKIDAGNELDALRELLKMANRDEQKSFSQTMDELVDTCYPFFLAHDAARLKWGNVPFLFGGDAGELSHETVAELASRLGDAMEILHDEGDKTAVRRLATLADFCRATGNAIGRLPEDVKKLFENLSKYNASGWESAVGTGLTVASKWPLLPALGDVVRALFCHLRAILLRQARVRSNAVYQLMVHYNDAYHSEVRSAGLLTFADIPYLLQCRHGETDFRLFANDRVNLEERLDAQLNHYLFDEFQDTSDLQWNAFDNLLDELVNDRGDRFRTFFCVGDIKQSIYRFRQGNPRLFGKVIAKTKTVADTLTLSRRSVAQVMELVNRIFEKPKKAEGFLSVAPRLKFEEHKAHRKDPGFAALVEFDKDNQYDTCRIEKADFILQTLAQVQPFQRGLSVGILMRNNNHLRDFGLLLQYLIRERKMGLNVSIDGNVSVLESQAVELFLQLLVLARHPMDASARLFLSLARFGGTRLDWKTWGRRLHLGIAEDAGELAIILRHALEADGIVGLADRFLAGFGAHFSENDRRMFTILRDMAGDFTGDPDDFRDRLQWLQEEEKSLAGTIQLMTIHKSKGLEFDLVFIPEFDVRYNGVNLLPEVDVPDENDALAIPQWIGYLPEKSVLSTIPEGARHVKARDREEQYDDACAVYVALTRAKRALYLLFAKPGDKSQQPEATVVKALAVDDDATRRAQSDFQRLGLLRPDRVKVRCAIGNSDYFTAIAMKPAPESAQTARDVSALRVKSTSTLFARPSAAHGNVSPRSQACFEPVRGAETGTILHALFEKIGFLDEKFDPMELLRQEPVDARYADEVRTLFLSALASTEIADALKRPAADVVLWREKDFLHRTGNGIVSGTFDRVVLVREKGAIVRAEILDYKSDRLATPKDFLARHALQLQIYRDALAEMTHLAPEKIACTLLALRLGKTISVPLR